jgi:hypothetical protein
MIPIEGGGEAHGRKPAGMVAKPRGVRKEEGGGREIGAWGHDSDGGKHQERKP